MVGESTTRSQKVPAPAELASEVAGTLAAARVVQPPEAIAHGGTPRADAIMAKLKECFDVADELMAHARTDDGEVRNAKLLLAASEHLRRACATLLKFHESMYQASQIDCFHDELIAVIESVAHEYPAAGEAILRRIREFIARWRG